MPLIELEKIRAKAYENAHSYKEMPMLFYDKHILRKMFVPVIKVLLYDAKLHLFSGKLRSLWTGPYIVSLVFPCDAIKIQDVDYYVAKKKGGSPIAPKTTQEFEAQ